MFQRSSSSKTADPALPLSVLLRAAFLGLASCATGRAQVGVVQTLAPGVYFHEGDPKEGTCNNGWIVMDDYVVEVDANFPSGAKVVIPKIRALTAKPVRFVIDTHFHPDHSSGNEIWVQEFHCVIVAQEATLDRLRLSGTSIWALQARIRSDVAASRLHLPDVAFLDKMAFEDAGHRVEVRFFGPAHTDGDALVWLPRERILFTGDVCVNGSYNFLHDGHLRHWIGVLNRAARLGPEIVCPGHGPRGGPEMLADQARYFEELLRRVQTLADSGDTMAEAEAAGPRLAGELRASPSVSRYVPTDYWFRFQVEKAYSEITGRPLPD